MWRTKVVTIFFMFIISATALIKAPIAAAQGASEPAPGPIPTPLLTSKRVFISNAGSTIGKAPVNLAYNEFYTYMKSWGKYELVSAPADSDLIFEIHFVAAGTPFFGTHGEDAEQICLVMLDTKTRVVLWVVTEPVRGAGFESSARKNFDRAMTSLVGNVKKLTTP
jgi:hypothetical protein